MIGYNTGEERARRVLQTLAGHGHRAQQIVLEDTSTMGRAAEEVRRTYGRADILVNSAGFTRPIPDADLDALDDALLDWILITNVRGPFAMIRATRPCHPRGHDGASGVIHAPLLPWL